MISIIKSCLGIFTNEQDNRCTCFPNGNWLRCCRAHDYGCSDAAAQKSAAMRLAADQQLKACVEAKGHPDVAAVMFYFARIRATLKGGY